MRFADIAVSIRPHGQTRLVAGWQLVQRRHERRERFVEPDARRNRRDTKGRQGGDRNGGFRHRLILLELVNMGFELSQQPLLIDEFLLQCTSPVSQGGQPLRR